MMEIFPLIRSSVLGLLRRNRLFEMFQLDFRVNHSTQTYLVKVNNDLSLEHVIQIRGTSLFIFLMFPLHKRFFYGVPQVSVLGSLKKRYLLSLLSIYTASVTFKIVSWCFTKT